MKLIYKLSLLFAGIGSLFIVSLAYSQDNFKLKLGAKGKHCLDCHANFQEKIKSPFVHTPVKTGNCTGCHNPHASSHGKLLAANPSKVCSGCHTNIIPEKAMSVHKVAVEGNCVKCHDPHAAGNKFNLLKAGNDLCFDCHKDMGEKIKKVRFRHAPVSQGCISCHNPHASAKGAFLLVDSVPALCKKCHKTDTASFAKQHMNYPVANAACTTCHNPHGSDRGGILFNNVHKPVAEKMCDQCHEGPASQTPFGIKKPGYELCKGCHSSMMNETFGKNRLHWAVVGKKGCLNCHNPHASAEGSLLKGPLKVLCGECHGDTVARQERSQTKHPPIAEGMCTACHSPHSSENDFLFNQSSILELCGSCHDWQKHATHPIGEKVRDPRNKNLSVECLSCHRSHGTENKFFIYFPVISEMCTQCHTQYKR